MWLMSCVSIKNRTSRSTSSISTRHTAGLSEDEGPFLVISSTLRSPAKLLSHRLIVVSYCTPAALNARFKVDMMYIALHSVALADEPPRSLR